MAREFPDVTEYSPDHPSLLRRVVYVIKNIMQGRTNNVHSVTLTANAGTTTVTLAVGDIGQESAILFMPTTANAATEFGAGTMYVSSRTPLTGQFVITHTNTASTDKTFTYIIVG